MTEFKIGDMVELEVDLENSKQKFQKGRVGIIVGIGTKGIEIKFSEGNLITVFSYLKKIGELRPNLPNRDEWIKRLYDTPQTNIMKGSGKMLNEDELSLIEIIKKDITNPDMLKVLAKVIDYNQKSNIDKIFEMLGVKVNKGFKINSFSSPITYCFDDNFVLHFQHEDYSGWFKADNSILEGLLCGKYKIAKLPQQILTGEEKEFLSNFKYDYLKKLDNYLYLCKNHITKTIINLNTCKHKYVGLNNGVEYTPQELGLCSK